MKTKTTSFFSGIHATQSAFGPHSHRPARFIHDFRYNRV
jgi:hypothetical protein